MMTIFNIKLTTVIALRMDKINEAEKAAAWIKLAVKKNRGERVRRIRFVIHTTSNERQTRRMTSMTERKARKRS